MNADREVIRGEEKKSEFSLFGRKETASKKASRPPGVHSHSISGTASMGTSTATADDDLPPRTSHDLATTDEKANIPEYAGFDFQAIKGVIGKEDLDVDKIPVPHSGPGVDAPSMLALTQPPQLLERSESAPPLTESAYSPIGAAGPPDTPTAYVVQLPHDDTADLSSTVSRSLSLSDIPKGIASTSSPMSPMSPIVSTPPLRKTPADPSQQTSTDTNMSTASFGSVGGDIWASGAALSTDTQLVFGRADGTNFGSNSSSYGFSNRPTNGEEPDAFAAAPTLTFGGANGSTAEDPWKPEPIMGEHKKYTPNPWGN
jgi:hypothetical protein